MPTNPHPITANIYQFPLKGRFDAHRAREAAKTAHLGKNAPLAFAPLGSGWYHEAALRDAEPCRKA